MTSSVTCLSGECAVAVVARGGEGRAEEGERRRRREEREREREERRRRRRGERERGGEREGEEEEKRIRRSSSMDMGIRLVGSRIAPHGNAHVCAHAAGVPCARSRALSPFRFNRSRRLVLTPNPHSHSRALACIRSDVGAGSRRNPASHGAAHRDGQQAPGCLRRARHAQHRGPAADCRDWLVRCARSIGVVAQAARGAAHTGARPPRRMTQAEQRQVVRAGEHCRARLSAAWFRHCHAPASGTGSGLALGICPHPDTPQLTHAHVPNTRRWMPRSLPRFCS